MSFEWPVVDIADVCSVGDGAHSKVQRMDRGVLYLTSKNIGQGTLKLDKVDYISEESFSKLFPVNSKATRRPEAGDVLLGIIGTFGNAYIYKESDGFGFSSSIGILRPDKAILNSVYLYYVISSPKFKVLHASSDGGSVQGYTNIPTIKKLPLPLPPLVVQESIANLLRSLDDRITLLRETNATLEAITQALFKSWFVDFDPVRVKAEGLEPQAMDAPTAALFPDRFEESGLGLVPKGWIVATMADISTVGIGKTPPRKEQQWFSEDLRDVRWVSIRDMGALGVYANQTSEYLTSEAVEKFNVRRVPDNTVLMSFKMTIGRVAITEGEMTTNEAIAHFRLDTSSPLSSEYIYLHLRQFDFSTLSSTSSIADAVNSKAVREIPILVPSKQVAAAFQDQVITVFARLKKNEQQAQTLTQLRDTLLPRLISGQLRLPEAEQAVEEALA